MFLNYYQLAEEPFGVTPDPRFLYLGAQHREALASLVHGTESNRGFLALIAEPGTGKTSLLYRYLADRKEKGRVAFVFRSDCKPDELIRYVLLDLDVDISGMDQPAMHEALNRILREEQEAGRRFVLVIDEAQSLEKKTLESIRLLSNFETPWMKLMVIVLAGQPEFAERLASPSLAQLRQRISMTIRIEPFTTEETNAYIDHRLWVAGSKNPSLFTVAARQLIAEHAQGIPRNINNICFNALSLGCALRRPRIDADIIQEVIEDLDLTPPMERSGAKKPIGKARQELTYETKRDMRRETVADSIPDSPLTFIDGARADKGPKTSVAPGPGKRDSSLRKWIPRLTATGILLVAAGGSAGELNRGELRAFRNNAGFAASASGTPATTGPAIADQILREATTEAPGASWLIDSQRIQTETPQGIADEGEAQDAHAGATAPGNATR